MVGLALGLAVSAPAADDVIYPHGTAPAGAPLPPQPAGVSSTSLLVVALVAAAAGGWLLWQRRRTTAGLTDRDARKLAVLESRSLGNRQYLVVAGYEGRKFLLAVCPGRIDLLSPLDGGSPPKAP